MALLEVGVIGLGRMGQHHARIYSNLKRVQLVGVYDTNRECAERISRQVSAPVFDSIDQLLDAVDAVSIVTPTPTHNELIRRCLDKKVHCLVEKPITETVEQARAITEAIETSGVVVQVGHIERFNPAYLEMKNVLEDVSPLAVNFRRLSPYSGSNKDVNVVLDLMIHDTDLALDMAGEYPVKVMASGLSVFGSAIDHAVTQLIFSNGIHMTLTASRITEEKVRSIEVTAREAYLETNLLNKTVQVHRRSFGAYQVNSQKEVKYRQESVLESILVPVMEPLYSELQHFTNCILEKTPVKVSPKSGLRALELATEICMEIQKNSGLEIALAPGQYSEVTA